MLDPLKLWREIRTVYVCTCMAGHRKIFRWFGERRRDRWMAKHNHLNYPTP